jgi:hypothetical protein
MNLYLHREMGKHKRRWYQMLLDGTLRQEYDRRSFGPESLALEDGTLKKDRTLSVYLQNHYQSTTDASSC